ncbi:MAG: hypothetical protein WCS94_22710 [Verrucomicrobiota bacterium]
MIDPNEVKKIQREGYDAYAHGDRSPDKNPYPYGTQERQVWESGRNEAWNSDGDDD